MSVRIENISKDLIEWAIIRDGHDLDNFYYNNPKVQAWISGDSKPTIKQLEDFTHKVHVPFGYMFLDEPPTENIPLPFFRSLASESTKMSLNVFHTVQLLKDRQEWLTEYMKELEIEPLHFVGKYDLDSYYVDIINDIRNTLNLDIDWATKLPNWEEAMSYLVNKIEDAGIIVTFNGVVENNTRRVIDVKECRGFVLVDKHAPFLFINSTDAKAAQMFTLIHELAHIWLGKSAGFDNQNLLPANDPLELLCDKIAAEFLVPAEILLSHLQRTKNLIILSRIFKVSPIVIARRLLDLKYYSKDDFFEYYNDYIRIDNNKKEARKPGGDFQSTVKKRISVKFVGFVNHAVKSNKLLYRDAYKLTSLKGETYNKFITQYL